KTTDAPLRRADRELVAPTLDRAGGQRRRIPDLVRDARRELSDRGELLVKARFALELLHLRQVLEQEEQALLAIRVPQRAQRIAEHVACVLAVELDLSPIGLPS